MNNVSMLDLFRMEVEAQAAILNNNLLALETNPNAATELEGLMRASHSIKGAARVVQLDAAVKIAHVMEDCFVAAQNGSLTLDSADKIDVLLQGVDMLLSLSQVPNPQLETWLSQYQSEIENLVTAISSILTGNLNTHIKSQPVTKVVHKAPSSPSPNKDAALTETPTNSLTAPPSVTCDLSMLALFRTEVETQTTFLKEQLNELKSNSDSLVAETLVQAAHVIKGASKIVQIDGVVKIALALEENLLAALKRKIPLQTNQIDNLLRSVDLLLRLTQVSEIEIESWLSKHDSEIATMITKITESPLEQPTLKDVLVVKEPSTAELVTNTSSISDRHKENSFPVPVPVLDQPVLEQKPETRTPAIAAPKAIAQESNKESSLHSAQNSQSVDRVVRVSADNLNRLMGLAGESLVEANWLQPFADSLFKLRNQQLELHNLLEKLQESLADQRVNQRTQSYLSDSRKKSDECRQFLADRLSELELFARRSANLSDRLYREVIASHMRPFADGVQGFPRMMRDLARRLGKQVKFEIIGKSTQVDRDILEKLEAPLTHILRNSVDHGIESPDERQAVGKPVEGTVRLEAVHRSGMLLITVSDDGKGVDIERLREKTVNKGMTTAEMAAQLTEAELMEFLFLPGFSTAKSVTEISGRGVGLDVVQSMVQEVGGIVRAVSQFGKGMAFHLQLPLTLSVIRTLLVEISGEPYAFPLTRIERIVTINKSDLRYIENRQYFTLDGLNIGLVAAEQVLDLQQSSLNLEVFSVVIVSDRSNRYGLVVDKFLGERDLVVRPLDTRLGKVPDISAAALMSDGSPVLIIDVEDMMRSIDKRLNNKLLSRISQGSTSTTPTQRKRILVVDDSITVREVERKLLENKGYQVDVAVNGMDGWNAVRTGNYDLVISDIDMPRMNGFELVSQIKQHNTLQSLPVIIVSYKDRESDRIRGLEVGADYYLTKSSFHDDTLLNSVIALIGD
ncbi:hybrid sensor histidine kinase/response regulator [Iningainema sp. BLCCT55]|uniref:histidine kinase n=2 Tax=Iningainema TaxID=1932705 RepID=A0A8J6XH10_9CYAN|nr:hybrid sensor histidine kinase/response regulator [Iningainema tapete BLCC-T55]